MANITIVEYLNIILTEHTIQKFLAQGEYVVNLAQDKNYSHGKQA